MSFNYEIKRVTKAQAEYLLNRWHYLSDTSSGFKYSPYSYGVFDGQQVVSACIFTGFPVAELFKGIWGIKDFRGVDQSGFFELSRLVIDPAYQAKNLASWFVSRSIKQLRNDFSEEKGTEARALLSYADDKHHSGVVYAATNFGYYGLTDPKYNVWLPCKECYGGKYLDNVLRPGRDETHWKQMTRGWKTHLDNGGILVPRGQKHRFLMVWDRSLPEVRWEKQKWTNTKAGQAIDTHPKKRPLQHDFLLT